MNKVTRYLLFSQLIFFGSMLTCLMLRPSVVRANVGVSEFGTVGRTLVPYMTGLLLTSYFMARAAHRLDHHQRRQVILADWLLAIAILIIAVSLTPYSIGSLFDTVHVVITGIAFALEIGLAIWLVAEVSKKRLLGSLLAVQLAGALVCTASLSESFQFMLTGQLISQLAFGGVLILGVDSLVRKNRPKTMKT